MSEPGWPIELPPTADELPSEDGIPMETQEHRLQADLLEDSLDLEWAGRDFFVGGNMFLYYSLLQRKKNDFRGPDLFVVLDVERRLRKSWVVWEEDGKYPDVVIELTSPSTRDYDHDEKKRIYSLLRVPEYFICDPLSMELEGFRLNAAHGTYDPIRSNGAGRLASERLGLELGPVASTFRGYQRRWLRWFRPDGTVLPTQDEARQGEAQARQAAERRAAEAEARAAELERRLAAGPD